DGAEFGICQSTLQSLPLHRWY
ncbi:hypothetical protein CCACVL1_00234, partial [Corchorus capsularis]